MAGDQGSADAFAAIAAVLINAPDIEWAGGAALPALSRGCGR